MNQESKTFAQGEIVNDSKASSPLKSLVYAVVAIFMVIYLLNPTAGFDFLPDNFPLIGNIDEATATAALLVCLSHFGIELPWLRKK